MWLENLIVNSNLFEFFYNVLIGLVDLFPQASIGWAVILLTLFVKTVLIPLTYRSIRHQIQQKKIQPMLQAVRTQYPDDKKKQSEEIMKIYKDHKTNPFSGCFLVLIQIAIIIPLYYVFLNLDIMPDRLYGFISAPESINSMFLGIDLAGRSIIFAILAGVSQFIQMYLSPAMRDVPQLADSQKPSTQAEMMQNMQKSMKYTMPIMIAIFAYFVPAAVALYWIVSNLFTITQEIVIRKKFQGKEVMVVETPSSS
jgi:YidC/Oxa1 family membrane protein insertase